MHIIKSVRYFFALMHDIGARLTDSVCYYGVFKYIYIYNSLSIYQPLMVLFWLNFFTNEFQFLITLDYL